jgi:hypothetical protein
MKRLKLPDAPANQTSTRLLFRIEIANGERQIWLIVTAD